MLRPIAVLCAALFASSCATFAPPEPCSAAWFDWEADQAFQPVKRDAGRALDRLQSAQAALEADDPGVGAAMRLAFAAESGLRVIEALEAETMPRLQSAALTCDDPAFPRRAVFDFLEDQGVDDLFSGESGAAFGAGLSVALAAMLAQSSAPTSGAVTPGS